MVKQIWIALVIGVLFPPANSARADFSAGMQAYESKDYPTALAQLRPEAESGNRIAQNIIGVIYMNGLGVPKDDTEAMKWYRLAADQGFSVAQTNVGFLYENGRGVARDLAEARRWYEKAAAQADPRANAFLRRLAMEERFPSFVPGGPGQSQPLPPPSSPPPVATVSPPDSTKMLRQGNPQADELAQLVLRPPEQGEDTSRLLATIVTRSLDNPKRWNEGSTDWQPIMEAVRTDLIAINKRFDSQRQDIQQQREKLLSAIYTTSIPGPQLMELLDYYHSNQGRRYLAFMQEVNTVMANAATELTGDLLVAGIKDPGDISKLPAQEQKEFSENAEERLRILKLSRSYRAQLAKNDAKAAMGAGNLMGIIAARYGDNIDRISEKYATDLDGFEKFSDSIAAQTEIMGFLKISSVSLPVQQKFKNEYLAEIASYRTKWLQLYTSRTKQSPGAPLGDKT